MYSHNKSWHISSVKQTYDEKKKKPLTDQVHQNHVMNWCGILFENKTKQIKIKQTKKFVFKVILLTF